MGLYSFFCINLISLIDEVFEYIYLCQDKIWSLPSLFSLRVASRATLLLPFSFAGEADQSENGVVNTRCRGRSRLGCVVVFDHVPVLTLELPAGMLHRRLDKAFSTFGLLSMENNFC